MEVSMRNVIVSEFVTLDGVMEDPGGAEGFEHGGWSIRLSSEEQQRFKFDELAAADALLLGRTTYEGFAAAWPGMMEGYDGPGRAELQDYADMMNSYPKHVVSTTLTEPLEWNNATLIKGNVAEEVKSLKEQPGKDILVFGSGELVSTLMEHGLVDEYRLMVFPIVVGGGKRLFKDGGATANMELLETKTVGPHGVVVITYRPADRPAQR
jgi:dihydrofolate reductase